jgi:hypothetical protein
LQLLLFVGCQKNASLCWCL